MGNPRLPAPAWRRASGRSGSDFADVTSAQAGLAGRLSGWFLRARSAKDLAPSRYRQGRLLHRRLDALAPHYHVLGTDKVGQDVSLKSVRTGLLIGS
jgi:ABC-type dipeptide/oligopeptide/nickel transport system permease subunit